MPAYTIQKDPTWIPARGSTAPSTTSMYSDDFFNPSRIPGNEPPDVPPLRKRDPDHAHPEQQIHDRGPQIRQSKLPIFKQVRSMLHKPPTLTTPGNPKWDEYTGELSESGKESKIKPSKYVSPYDAAFKASRKRSPERPTNKLRKNKSGNQSPVSVLRDEELVSTEPQQPKQTDDTEWSPVSPVSPISTVQDLRPGSEVSDVVVEDMPHPSMIPEPLSPNIQRTVQQVQQTPPSSSGRQQIKRKPVSRDVSAMMENRPPEINVSPQHSPSQSVDMDERVIDDKDGALDEPQPRSHFSWTTYAPSVAPGRPSIDTVSSPPRNTKHYPSGLAADEHPNSRFSWSTVNTNMTQHQQPARGESPPPPLPEKQSGPPVQSILSRRRPIQRYEKEEWAPPPRKESKGTPKSATPKDSSTPTSAKTSRPLPLPKDSTPTGRIPTTTSGKALPPPPSISNKLTHLETLLAQERDLALQRKNVERGISELTKIEFASPMDVPFAHVRDAKKRLAEYRQRLDEVRLEERDIGIAIARARRKEEKEYGGDGETLWVRRVTS